uniref:glycosyl transferase n=1 Tax=Pedobacter schmidteae TaxID=2201271 RepID=UPI000EB5330C|nr:glycosyl transferase [Pedobacter schmidteae]
MIQKIINILYRHPRSAYRTFKHFGGLLSYQKMKKERKEMQKQAGLLPPVTSYPDGLNIYFLTGKKYLYQTLFCIQSLTRVSQQHYHFTLIDDGSFDHSLIEQAKLKLPGCHILLSKEIEDNLKLCLPEHQYPKLHHKRRIYPHLKKLTDIHTLPGNKWRLVLDSDMLFWQEPRAMNAWLKSPRQPLFMRDCKAAYGYSKSLMEKCAGGRIQPLLNVGAVGLTAEMIDWAAIENWIEVMEAEEGTSYFLEQALSAMIVGATQSLILPAQDYLVNPTARQLNHKQGILHHYVDLSKKHYYTEAWRKIIL